MGRQRILFRGLAVATAGAAALTLARRRASGRLEGFYASLPAPAAARHPEAAYGGPPWVFHASDSVLTVHSASFDAVRAVLPSALLCPARMPDGRAIVLIVAARHGDVTASGVDGPALPPYGEVIIAAGVTRRPSPPLLPLVAPPGSGFAAGWFVLHLPVTSRLARDAGRLEWGYPKFTADMEFDESIAESSILLGEGGHEIFHLTTRPAGRPTIWTRPFVVYSSLDGELIEESMPGYALRQTRYGARGGHLELGDHQVADELRELAISPEPFMTVRSTGGRMAMGPGRAIGQASQYLGFIGDEREFGRYVVRYAKAPAIDRYQRPAAGPTPPAELSEAIR